MENQLEALKRNLPINYTSEIAKRVGCSRATVINVMGGKKFNRSAYESPILEAAASLAEENMKAREKALRKVERVAEKSKEAPYEAR